MCRPGLRRYRHRGHPLSAPGWKPVMTERRPQGPVRVWTRIPGSCRRSAGMAQLGAVRAAVTAAGSRVGFGAACDGAVGSTVKGQLSWSWGKVQVQVDLCQRGPGAVLTTLNLTCVLRRLRLHMVWGRGQSRPMQGAAGSVGALAVPVRQRPSHPPCSVTCERSSYVEPHWCLPQW